MRRKSERNKTTSTSSGSPEKKTPARRGGRRSAATAEQSENDDKPQQTDEEQHQSGRESDEDGEEEPVVPKGRKKLTRGVVKAGSEDREEPRPSRSRRRTVAQPKYVEAVDEADEDLEAGQAENGKDEAIDSIKKAKSVSPSKKRKEATVVAEDANDSEVIKVRTTSPEKRSPSPDKQRAPSRKERTPSPKKLTPSKQLTPPKQQTPSPKQRTPSPKLRIPSPKQRTPSPKQSTPSPKQSIPEKEESAAPSAVKSRSTSPAKPDIPIEPSSIPEESLNDSPSPVPVQSDSPPSPKDVSLAEDAPCSSPQEIQSIPEDSNTSPVSIAIASESGETKSVDPNAMKTTDKLEESEESPKELASKKSNRHRNPSTSSSSSSESESESTNRRSRKQLVKESPIEVVAESKTLETAKQIAEDLRPAEPKTRDKTSEEKVVTEKENQAVVPVTAAPKLAKPVRKRKWLTQKSTEMKPQILAISTDSLKNLISDVRPVPLCDVKLDSSPESGQNDEDSVEEAEPIQKSSRSHRRGSSEDRPVKLLVVTAKPVRDLAVGPVEDKPARKVVLVSDTSNGKTVEAAANKVARPPSPAKFNSSSILYITNLVRPFTVLQLKGLLARTGKISENGFWIDKIKSKCFVKYETEE